jgi:hypothetical protein
MKALTLNPMAKAGAILFLLLLQTKPALAHGCSTPAFAAPLTFGAAPGPSVSVATGDFNGDAKAGLVLGHEAAFDGNLYTFPCCWAAAMALFRVPSASAWVASLWNRHNPLPSAQTVTGGNAAKHQSTCEGLTREGEYENTPGIAV